MAVRPVYQRALRFTLEHNESFLRLMREIRRDPAALPPEIARYLTPGRELSESEIAGAAIAYAAARLKVATPEAPADAKSEPVDQ